MNSSTQLSAGLKALPDKIKSFASTQAAWRFYANESITLSGLQQPLTEAAHQGIEKHCKQYALCIHDWSRLHFSHQNKRDTYAITHALDVGYDLQTSLIISDQTGQPIAPVAQRLVSADGSYSTYAALELKAQVQTHLDEVSECIEYLKAQEFSKPLVHIIDREADSVGHIRRWQSAACHWLVRVKDNPKVEYQGLNVSCKTLAETLSFSKAGQILYRGKKHDQWLAEASVMLTRPAKPSQKKAYKPVVHGEAVSARFIVSRIISAEGVVVAQWLLMSNVTEVNATTLALWYYWRWQIESFFKLIKQAGHQLESWQQESALAISKRLLVSSMACVTVWEIASAESSEAAELRALLMKLSGRQTKRSNPITHPALLSGLWVWLSMLEVFTAYSPEELLAFRKTTAQFLGRDV